MGMIDEEAGLHASDFMGGLFQYNLLDEWKTLTPSCIVAVYLVNYFLKLQAPQYWTSALVALS